MRNVVSALSFAAVLTLSRHASPSTLPARFRRSSKIGEADATSDLLAKKQPSRTLATPSQIGCTVAFLSSDAAEQITGTTISIDGGWMAR